MAGEQAVYLHDLCEAEQYVAFRLWELAAGEIVAPHGLEELIDRIQAEQGITYAHSSARQWSWPPPAR